MDTIALFYNTTTYPFFEIKKKVKSETKILIKYYAA